MGKSTIAQKPTTNLNSAACKFCGQCASMGEETFTNQADADEYATEHCACFEARRYTDRKISISKAGEEIEAMFNENDCDDNVKIIMSTSTPLVYDGQIEKISIKIKPGLKSEISKTTKGKLKFTRSDSAAYSREV